MGAVPSCHYLICAGGVGIEQRAQNCVAFLDRAHWTDGLSLFPEQFRAIPWRIRCAWQPEGILDISFHVSVFLLSLPWARLCLWSWSLAQTRCYVGFYGGKKKHMGCQTWKSIKKGEEGSGGRVVRGVWGGEEMWSSCALKVESWFHPSLPSFELWGVGFAFQVCKVRLQSVWL